MLFFTGCFPFLPFYHFPFFENIFAKFCKIEYTQTGKTEIEKNERNVAEHELR